MVYEVIPMNRPKKSALFRRLRMTFFCVPLAAIFLLPQLFSGFLLPRQVETAVIHTAAGDVTRREFETSNSSFTQHIRTWTDTENTAVRSDRFAPVSGTQTHESTVLTVKGTGTMRTYDVKANRWSEAPLRAGTFPKGMYFIRADGGDSIIVTPLAYRDRGTGMIEYLPSSDGTLKVTKTADGFSLSVQSGSVPAGAFSDSLALTSRRQLFDWNDGDTLTHWQNYRFTDDNRWCWSGYYYTAPPEYYPNGENYFHALPGAYITCKMVRNAEDGACRMLGIAMLDVMRQQQNELGFIPSTAGSTWLKNDYGIEPGYYDTRFNTDLWLAVVNAAENYGVTEWLPQARKYADFLVQYAQEHHSSITTGDALLVQDYWHPNGEGLPTHTSLNHHSVEAVFLYRLSRAVGDDGYALVADRMVKGIEQTVSRWVRPDGNLHYSLSPAGVGGGADYPYLTYNDLVDLQTQYTARFHHPNSAIRMLAQTKLNWMQKNHVVILY